jgi:hypothetical protein
LENTGRETKWPQSRLFSSAITSRAVAVRRSEVVIAASLVGFEVFTAVTMKNAVF